MKYNCKLEIVCGCYYPLTFYWIDVPFEVWPKQIRLLSYLSSPSFWKAALQF